MFLLWMTIFSLSLPIAAAAGVLHGLLQAFSRPLRAVGVSTGDAIELLEAGVSLPSRCLRFVLGGPFAQYAH